MDKPEQTMTDCWQWQQYIDPNGYGRKWNGKPMGNGRGGRMLLAHRWVYEMLELIPEGMTLDHLCRNQACVNPDHLEVVTVAENIRRGVPYRKVKTGCPRGHPYDPTLKGQSGRICRPCKQRRNRDYARGIRKARASREGVG